MNYVSIDSYYILGLYKGYVDTHIFVELCAMPDKIPFYEKFGFSANEAQRLRIMYHVN